MIYTIHIRTIRSIIAIVIVCLLIQVGGCSTINNTCLFGGCYGPFDLVVKTKDGEQVEDLIVILTHVTADHFEGTTRTYSHTVLADTNETIKFPRGFVYRPSNEGPDSDEWVYIDIYIHHFDYYLYSQIKFANMPNDNINLGFVELKEHKKNFSKGLVKSEEILRKSGKSEKEIKIIIDKEIKSHNEAQSRLSNAMTYFKFAADIGHDEVVDKYLPMLLKDYAKSVGKEDEYSSMEVKYRKAIYK